jgi:hypothetical protein
MTRRLKAGVVAGLVTLAATSSAQAFPASTQNTFTLTSTLGSCTWHGYGQTAHSGGGDAGLMGHMAMGDTLTCAPFTPTPDVLLQGTEAVISYTVAGQPVENAECQPILGMCEGHAPPGVGGNWLWCTCSSDDWEGWDDYETPYSNLQLSHTVKIDLYPYTTYPRSLNAVNLFWTSYPAGCAPLPTDVSELDCTFNEYVTV